MMMASSVVEIGQNAFGNCSSLKSLVFNTDSELKLLGDYAFSGCIRLASMLQIPINIVSIGNSAFANCSLINITKFDPTYDLEFIGEYAFYQCKFLYVTLTLHSKLTKIGAHAFSHNLTKLVMRNATNLVTVGDYAFNSTNEGYNVIIHSKVTTIGAYAFGIATNGLFDLSLSFSLEYVGSYAFVGGYDI